MAKVFIFAADVDDIIARTKTRPGIRWGNDADRDAIVTAGDVPQAWVNGLFDKRGQLVVAEDDGRIIGHNIYTTSSPVMQKTWLLINLRPGYDYLSLGGYVVPERRGQRLLADIKGFAARHFAAKGYRRNVSMADADNRSSLKAHAAVGATPLMILRRARIGKLSLIVKDHCPPRPMWGNTPPFAVTV